LNFAQDHIDWAGQYDAKSKKVVLTALLDSGWHLYSQNTDESGGPVATKFELKENDLLTIESPMMEPEPIVAYDPNFESEVIYFESKVDFEQKIAAKANTEATYTITYMICNEEMCLPPVDKLITLTITK
jgi:thiol:disulfide interchange protein DsbD